MKAADSLVAGEEDLYLSDEDEDDRMSLASDLDSDDMAEVEEKEKELEKKAPKKYVSASVLVTTSRYTITPPLVPVTSEVFGTSSQTQRLMFGLVFAGCPSLWGRRRRRRKEKEEVDCWWSWRGRRRSRTERPTCGSARSVTTRTRTEQ